MWGNTPYSAVQDMPTAWLVGRQCVCVCLSVCLFAREETTMRSTPTLGPSAMKSPVQRKHDDFVSSFSSHERTQLTDVTVMIPSLLQDKEEKTSNRLHLFHSYL